MTSAFLFPRLLAASVAVLILPLLPAAAADEPHPLAILVKSQVKDPAKPFTLVVALQAKDGMGAKVEAAFVKAVKETRKEKGCLSYDLNRDAKDPNRFLVYERWKSLADLEAHLKTAHITALLGDLKDVLSGPPEGKVLLPAAE